MTLYKNKANLSQFVFEVTHSCNHNCLYCYNPWKNPFCKYPSSQIELSTSAIKAIIIKLLEQTRIKYLAISGGEPLLRDDTPGIIKFCTENNIKTNLLTNGALLTEENCRKCTAAGTAIFEIPFLTNDPNLHYRLTGRNDLNDIIQGIKNLTKYKATIILVFVATKANIKGIKEAVEVMIALGAKGIMFNRFNPGGSGLIHQEELMPSGEDIRSAIIVFNDLVGYYGVTASVSIPIPRCLINPADFKHIKFGYCPSGNTKSYFTIDAYGNVRTCNHSSIILGNVLQQDFQDILHHRQLQEFQKALPEYCRECQKAENCWGGCKAAALVCNGNIAGLDPFLENILLEK